MIPIKNQQSRLAEEFHLRDIQIVKANYEANLKIRRWKFLMNIPGIGDRIRDEATIDIYNHFLIYADNSEILSEEGFDVEPIYN